MTQEMSTNRKRSDQLEAVCHDLKQHIATGMLLSEAPAGEELRDSVRSRFRVLHQQFEYAAALVALLSDDAGGHLAPADLGTLARQCVDAVKPGYHVVLEVDGCDHVVQGDPVLLRRAIANLLDNACRAATTVGTVTVRVGRSESERWVEVADDGPGFGEIGSGSGIGLSVVRDAIRSGMGRLHIDSEAGTTIRMTFPVVLRNSR